MASLDSASKAEVLTTAQHDTNSTDDMSDHARQGQIETKNILYPQRNLAQCLELVYLSSCGDNELATQVWEIADAGRTEHLAARETIQILGVTAEHIVNTLIPYLLKGIQAKNQALIKTMIQLTLKRINVMQESASKTQQRYSCYREELLALKRKIYAQQAEAPTRSNELDKEIDVATQMLQQAINDEKEIKLDLADMKKEFKALKVAKSAKLEEEENDGKARVQSLQNLNWLELLLGGNLSKAKIVNWQIEKNNAQRSYVRMEYDAEKRQRREEIEKQEGELSKEKTAIQAHEAEKARLTKEKGKAHAAVVLMGTDTCTESMDRYFTDMAIFWSKLGSQYYSIKLKFEDTEKCVELLDILREQVTESIETAKREWQQVIRFCKRYHEESDAILPEAYGFLSRNVMSMDKNAIEKRKEILQVLNNV